MTHTRRQFVRFVPAFGAFIVPALSSAQGQGALPADPPWPTAPARNGPVDEFFPSQTPALVKEMVGVSHGNVARVRELLQQHPELAKAAWDWGFGDWETALGAASHVGSRAIAELLLERGAPPTHFSAAMLGQLEVLKWLRANGCPWDIATSMAAKSAGHPELLQWAVDNGCPCSRHL